MASEAAGRPARDEAALRDALAAAGAARAALEPALAVCVESLVAASRALAARFEAGATLWVLGSGAAAPDADHVAVEFTHPVIVGKRALPAVSIRSDREGFAAALERLARPGDAVMGIGAGNGAEAVWQALDVARSRGLATFALASRDLEAAVADHRLAPPLDDPLLVSEAHVTLYHLLWECVQALLEARGHEEATLSGDAAALYPFLAESRRDDEPELSRALHASIAAKLADLATLRAAALATNASSLVAAARGLARVIAADGALLALGNGGSSTDAAATARLFAAPPGGRGARARSLADDPALLTALANDVGFESVFARQLAAFARPGDAVIAFSTSGNSENALAALDAAKRRDLVCIGVAGYDGGRMASDCALDALLVAPSESVHRIQEVQRTLVQVLWQLVRAEGAATCAS